MSNIKKQLQKEAKKDIPNIKDEIKTQADRMDLFAPYEDANDIRYTIRIGHSRCLVAVHTVILAVIFFAVLIFSIIFVPLFIKTRPSVPDGISFLQLSVNDFYGFGAISASKLVGNETRLLSDGQTDSKVRAEQENFEKYFSVLDGYFCDDFIKTETKQNDDGDYSQYRYKLCVSAKTFDESQQNYVLYYNETLGGNVETSFDDDENESYYSLDGIAVIDGEKFKLSGERSVETEDSESEEVLKIRSYSNVDPNSFVEFIQEISDENGESEVSYVYRTYSGGKVVEETEVKFETEIKKSVTNIELELLFKNGQSVSEYQIKRDGNEQDTAFVNYFIDGEKGSFIVKIKNGGVFEYVYS